MGGTATMESEIVIDKYLLMRLNGYTLFL